MKDYYSITHATSNENGQEEVEIEHNKSFLRWLFRKDAKKETYVNDGKPLSWREKSTNKSVTLEKHYEIMRIINRVNKQSIWYE